MNFEDPNDPMPDRMKIWTRLRGYIFGAAIIATVWISMMVTLPKFWMISGRRDGSMIYKHVLAAKAVLNGCFQGLQKARAILF